MTAGPGGNDAGPLDATGEPLRNTAVVEAMRNVSLDDRAESRALLFQLLLETTLIAVTPHLPQTAGTYLAQEGQTVNLVAFTDDDGTVLPLFTSVEAVRRWRPEPVGIVAVPSRALFEMAAAKGTDKISLDPGSPTSGYLTRYEIDQLARGRLPLGPSGDVVAAATEITIGKPATPPSAPALSALRTHLAAEPSARRAWYFLMQQGDQRPEMVVAIDFGTGRDGDPRAPMRTVIDGAGAQCEDVRSLSFVLADERWQQSLSSGAGELFYARVPA